MRIAFNARRIPMKILLTLLLICIYPICNAEPSNADLQNQVNELMLYISQLEKRVKRLEGNQSSSTSSLPTSKANASSHPWRQLKRGQSRQKVRVLLGEPYKIQGGAFEYWYYSSSSTLGPYVMFYNDVVNAWHEPK